MVSCYDEESDLSLYCCYRVVVPVNMNNTCSIYSSVYPAVDEQSMVNVEHLMAV